MAEWFGSLTSRHFPLTAVGVNPARDFRFFHARHLSIARLQNIGGSTQVPACIWSNAQRGTRGLLPPVKAGKVAIRKQCQYDLKTKLQSVKSKILPRGKQEKWIMIIGPFIMQYLWDIVMKILYDLLLYMTACLSSCMLFTDELLMKAGKLVHL